MIPADCPVQLSPEGLHCPDGGFWIDPWKPVARALVTHAHSDHARPGSAAYLTASPGVPLLAERVQRGAAIEGLGWGERRRIGGVTVSFHPAGHVLGSGQVRIERGGDVVVVSGDYKVGRDPAAEPFEPVRCRTFVTESTFGLPVYRWPDPATVREQILRWWELNRAEGLTSVLLAYPLGKSQRVLAAFASGAPGPVGVHGAVAKFLPAYRDAGVPLPEVLDAGAAGAAELRGRGLVVAPPSAEGTPWLRRLQPCAVAFASGWMLVRGARRRQALDRGFVLSDHADWPGLLEAIAATGAERVGVTHGFTGPLVRYLREERGLDAFEVPTRFSGEAAGREDGVEAEA